MKTYRYTLQNYCSVWDYERAIVLVNANRQLRPRASTCNWHAYENLDEKRPAAGRPESYATTEMCTSLFSYRSPITNTASERFHSKTHTPLAQAQARPRKTARLPPGSACSDLGGKRVPLQGSNPALSTAYCPSELKVKNREKKQQKARHHEKSKREEFVNKNEAD